MGYIGWALASAAVIDPERAVIAASGAVAAGLVIFFIRNKEISQRGFKKHHG